MPNLDAQTLRAITALVETADKLRAEALFLGAPWIEVQAQLFHNHHETGGYETGEPIAGTRIGLSGNGTQALFTEADDLS